MENGSRNASPTSSPTAPRRPPCMPTSCASGSPSSPMSCSVLSAGSDSLIPGSPGPHVARFGSSCSRSAPSSRVAPAAFASPWPQPIRGNTNSVSPTPCFKTPSPDTNPTPQDAIPEITPPNPASATLARKTSISPAQPARTPSTASIAAPTVSSETLGRVEDGRGGVSSVSRPRSSNRTCRFPASGFPTGFTAQLLVVAQCERVVDAGHRPR